jgi:hypothetical protein
MKFTRRATGVLATALVLLTAQPAPAAVHRWVRVAGAESTFVEQIMGRWISDFNRSTGAAMTYAAAAPRHWRSGRTEQFPTAAARSAARAPMVSLTPSPPGTAPSATPSTVSPPAAGCGRPWSATARASSGRRTRPAPGESRPRP